ncbi:IS3 family transposase, partial [Anaerococcus kampingiae]
MKLAKPIDKDKEIRKEITTIIEASKGRYGYRRVTMVLKN